MKKILLLIITLAGCFSCEDIDQSMTRDLTESSFWRNEQDALDALSSCYENMYHGDYYFANDALSDNAYNKSTSYEGVGQIASGSYNSVTARVTGEWGYHYSCIRKCNVLLENVDRILGSTEEMINRLKAEARFIRAFAHFHLATWYGDVPLVTKVLTISEAKTIERTPKSEIIMFVTEELQSIQQDLPVKYDDANRGRITRGAAIAMRARVNLYEGNWADVVNDCEKLINTTENGSFSLYNNYAGLFTVAAEYNPEILLDIEYAGSRAQGNQRLFLPPTVGKLRANLVPTKSLVDDYIMTNGKAISESGSGYDENNPYDNRDPRFEKTVLHHGSEIVDFEGNTQTILTQPGSVPGSNTIEDQIASATGYYFQKYYDPTAINYNSTVNLILLRYADVLLMYAEAKNELGEMTSDVWNKTIKPIRVRAGFTDAGATEFNAALSQAELQTVIRRERRSELAFEGLRIFDIRRWQIADQVLNEPVKGIKVSSGQFPQDANGYLVVEQRLFQAPKHYLWPIPQFEIDQNNNLNPNNTGW
jgi:starch-binding outer membrane protein, SusD/RagB family